MRPYGPGKYGTMLDAWLWSATMDGEDDSVGESEGFGYACLMRGPFVPETGDDVTPEERAFLAAQAGAIASEDSQGFVYVSWYEDRAEMDAAWGAIVEEYDSYLGECDE